MRITYLLGKNQCGHASVAQFLGICPVDRLSLQIYNFGNAPS
jgi:hypothetical protein